MKKQALLRIIISTLMFLFIAAAFSGVCMIAARAADIEFFPAFAAGTAAAVFWIILALLRGRIFCSYACPLGYIQDITGFLGRKIRRKKSHIQPPRRFLRYGSGILLLVLFASGLGAAAGFFEPFSVTGRVLNGFCKPLFQWLGNVTGLWDYSEITPVGTGVAAVSAVVMALIAIAAFFEERLFCNTLCPAGFLLGLFSRISRFRPKFSDRCNHCKACEKVCKTGCIDVEKGIIDNERCVVCGNCSDACKFSGMVSAGTFLPDEELPGKLDTKRRLFLGGLAAAGAAAALGKDAFNFRSPADAAPAAPPGAGTIKDFNLKCTGCQLCIANCPGKVLAPAALEYGIAGMGQPLMLPEKGFCDYNCTACNTICPAGALKPLTLAEKRLWRVGVVVYYKERCVVVKDGEACGACAEHCPTGALEMVDYKDGLTIPEVTPEICIGCGGCEYICPVRPLRAVEVRGLEKQSLIPEHEKMRPKEPEVKKAPQAAAPSADDAFPF